MRKEDEDKGNKCGVVCCVYTSVNPGALGIRAGRRRVRTAKTQEQKEEGEEEEEEEEGRGGNDDAW